MSAGKPYIRTPFSERLEHPHAAQQTMVETMQGQHERKDTDKMLGMLLHLLELYSLYSLIAVNS